MGKQDSGRWLERGLTTCMRCRTQSSPDTIYYSSLLPYTSAASSRASEVSVVQLLVALPRSLRAKLLQWPPSPFRKGKSAAHHARRTLRKRGGRLSRVYRMYFAQH